MTQDNRRPLPIVREVTHDIALEPQDWFTATWRPQKPVPRPKPARFNRGECLTRIRHMPVLRTYYQPTEWFRAGIPEAMTREEAHFWLLVLTEVNTQDPRPFAVANLVEKERCDGDLSAENLIGRLQKAAFLLPAETVRPLVNLLSPAEYIDLLLDQRLWTWQPHTHGYYQFQGTLQVLLDGFRTLIQPHITQAELEQLREHARGKIGPSAWSQVGHWPLHVVAGYRLAATLGLHRELLAHVSAWPDNLFPRRGSYEEWRQMPRETIFGLGDPWQVEQHMRRLGLLMRQEKDARAWLAHTETRALGHLADSIRGTSGHTSTRMITVLTLVRSPAAARPLLELRLDGYACPPLREWFDTQVGNATAGLVPVAFNRGKLGDASRQYLREVRRKGMTEVIEQQLAEAEPAAAARIRSTILDVPEVHYPPLEDDSLPGWLSNALLQLPKLPREELPEWLVLEDLPPLVVEGKAIGGRTLRTTVRALQACTPESRPALFTALGKHVEAAHREAFAWRLVEQWQCSGAPNQDLWVLSALAFLGTDESVLPLAALIRDWTGPTGRHRAMRGLACLSHLGTPLALQQLQGLARLLRSRPLRQYARDLFESAARQQGVSRAEFEDRAVPDLGFNGRLGPTFDFGPRQFQAVLGAGLEVVIRDSAGTVRTNLPNPGARDEAGLARQAVADWRRLRKTLKEVYREQARRLERAMIQGQRWPVRHFHQRILAQPLLAQIARMILWGGYDERGRLSGTFRITEEQTFVDVEESAVSLGMFNSLRIVHPLELNDEVRGRWLEVWRDHDLISPFPQMGRKLYPLGKDERTRKTITAFSGRRINALTLSGLIKDHDWQACLMHSTEPGEAHSKYFASADLTAVMHHPNVGQLKYPDHKAEQELRMGFFVHGRREVNDPVRQQEAVVLGDVPDLVRSEVCEAMALIHGKGREHSPS